MTKLTIKKASSIKSKIIDQKKEIKCRFYNLVEHGLPGPHKNYTKNILTLIKPEVEKMENTILEYENTISNLKKELIEKNKKLNCIDLNNNSLSYETVSISTEDNLNELDRPIKFGFGNITDEEKNKLKLIHERVNITQQEKDKLRLIKKKLGSWSQSKWEDEKEKKRKLGLFELIPPDKHNHFKNNIFNDHLINEFGLQRSEIITDALRRSMNYLKENRSDS